VELLQILCSNIITDGVNISATYRKPFDVLVEGLANKIWLPVQDATRTHPLTLVSRAQAARIKELERLIA
jgi:hypothetical protein